MNTLRERYELINERKVLELDGQFIMYGTDYHVFEDAESVLKSFNSKIKYIEISGEEYGDDGDEFETYTAIFYTGKKPKINEINPSTIDVINMR